MYKLFPELIRQGCASERTYSKGMNYFFEGAVSWLQYYPESNYFDAEVRGREVYDVLITFDEENGELVDIYCDCPAHANYPGFCKHVVAVLISIFDNMDEVERIASPRDRTADAVLEVFEKRRKGPGTELKLEYTLCFHLPEYQGVFPHRALRMRVGENRLYVVRSVKRFVEAVLESQSLPFGKQFVYDPFRHVFSSRDHAVMDLLVEIYEIDRMAETSFFNRPPFFESKEVCFTSKQFARLLDILQGQRVSAEINGWEYRGVEIKKAEAPLHFQLQEAGEELLVSFQAEEVPVPLTPDGKHFFIDRCIYCLPEAQRASFMPFYRGFLEKGDFSFAVSPGERERFLAVALPHLEQAGRLEVEEALAERLCREPLQAEVYLDSRDGAVTADVHFRYGTHTVAPLRSSESRGVPGEEEGLLVREPEKENQVLELLAELGFQAGSGEMLLQEEEKVLGLLREGLARLQEYAAVYYSEGFKRLAVKPVPRLQAFASINSKLDMLEVNLELDGIEPEELQGIWNALKEKKKFHRLKDGSFLPLESKELEGFSRLARALEAEEAELKKGVLRRPKAGALFMEELAEEEGLENLQLGGEVQDLIERVRLSANARDGVPEELKGLLRSYQETGYHWMKSLSQHGLGGILADDMGLGKTVQAIALLLSEAEEKKSRGETYRALVVAPTSVIYNWEAELVRFAPSLRNLVITGGKKEREGLLAEVDEYDVLITSYSLLRRDAEQYSALHFDLCLLDEAQYIKNPSSAAARAVRGLQTGNVFALTGTPLENSLGELWSVFQCVLPGLLPSYKKFKQKYLPARGKGDVVQKGATEELAAKVKPFILRRLKEEVLKELPPKIETPVYTELNREQKNVYLAYLENLRSLAARELSSEEGQKGRIRVLAGLTRLRQICCHPALFLEDYNGGSAKLEQLREMLHDTVGQGRRILLFSQFAGMLRLIRALLEEEGYTYFHLDGGVKTAERLKMVEAFNGGQGEVFLISLKAGGTGLNLTGADTVIQYDLWWNPAVEEQAAGRAHRLGQEKVVQVFRMLTRGTIEEKIDRLQQEKKDLIQKVIQPGETFLSALSDEEIREILGV